jgi:hypothetical protein
MPGPAPKPAHLRQRTNKKAGAASLEAPANAKAPQLPQLGEAHAWHPLTSGWWQRVWASPMAGEYLPSDIDGLVRLAMLVNEFYLEPKPTLLAEIRLQESRFGLSPLDRSRLQWEISKGEDAERKRKPPAPPARRTGTNDPRAILSVVK